MMPRRRRNEKGATLVEFAFIVPILMTITIGMFEMGLGWRDKVSATQAVRLSARTISHLGDGDTDGNGTSDVDVDREGLLSLRASMFDQWDTVEFVVVYRATTTGEMESASCLTGSSSVSGCNHYNANALLELDNAAYAIWDNANASWDWENNRDNTLAGADHVGVYVKFKHEWETGFFPGDGITITESAVLRMEPSAG